MSLQQISQQTVSANCHFIYKKKSQIHLKSENRVPPPLKWAGGKRWLVPYIQDYWKKHSHQRLVELFCGSLAITLGLRPKKALLNDINQPLIHFFKSLKKGLVVHSQFENSKDFYYKAREKLMIY